MKLTELEDKLKSIVDRLDAGEITTDQAVIELNGLFHPAPARSAEEMIEEQCFTVSEKSPFLITKENALEAMHAYASQFRREVTDAEIMIEGRARNDIMDNGGGYIHYPSFSSGAKWMREKMKGK